MCSIPTNLTAEVLNFLAALCSVAFFLLYPHPSRCISVSDTSPRTTSRFTKLRSDRAQTTNTMANLLANFLQEESYRLNGNIEKKITPDSPWLSQIPKKAWPDQIGHIITNVVWDRSYAAVDTPWEEIVSATGSNNVCLPTADLVEFRQTTYNTSLATRAIKSPQFCIDDLKVKWKGEDQMANVVKNLGEQTKKINIKRAQVAYQSRCSQKVVCNATLDTTGLASLITTATLGGIVGDAKFADAAATSIATHGVLDHFHAFLDREGAGQYASAQGGGGNVYKLITSPEHSQWLRKRDAATRSDIRESSMSDKLLKGLGITEEINGYAHVLDPAPRRWIRNAALTAANGWEEVELWVDGGSQKFVQNPAYRTAPYEDLVIFLPSVLDCMVPVPKNSVGQAKFKPQNYVGDFRFLNILHEDDNPIGNLGKFYGRITNGFKTLHPEHGITIRHQRAPLELDQVDVTA